MNKSVRGFTPSQWFVLGVLGCLAIVAVIGSGMFVVFNAFPASSPIQVRESRAPQDVPLVSIVYTPAPQYPTLPPQWTEVPIATAAPTRTPLPTNVPDATQPPCTTTLVIVDETGASSITVDGYLADSVSGTRNTWRNMCAGSHTANYYDGAGTQHASLVVPKNLSAYGIKLIWTYGSSITKNGQPYLPPFCFNCPDGVVPYVP